MNFTVSGVSYFLAISTASLIAALFAKRPPQLELSALPQSWGDAACVHVPELPMSSLIPGILEDTDLPELIAAVSELTRVNIAG